MHDLERFEVVVRWKYPHRTERRRCQLQNDYSTAPFRLTEIVDHVIRDTVIQGSEGMIDVRSWAEGVMNDDRPEEQKPECFQGLDENIE